MADPPRDPKSMRPLGRIGASSQGGGEGAPPAGAGKPGRYVPPAPGSASGREPTGPQATARGGLRTPSEAGALTLDEDMDGGALGQRERGRVTINFSGPPLELPGAPAPATSPAQGTVRAPTSSGRADAGSGSGAALDEHDAWVADRKRRSTLPPIAGLSLTPGSSAPPSGSALQHKWVSAHQAQAQRASQAPPIGLPDAGGDALTLADRGRPSEPALDLMAEVRGRYALDDLTGALKMAELLLGGDPKNAEAARYATICRERLERLYTSQLGPLTSIPRIDVPETDIRWLGLDHRAGFLLSRIDGFTSLDELLDLSGMPRLEALKTVLSLVDAGAIAIPR